MGLRNVAHAALANTEIGGGVEHVESLVKQSKKPHAHRTNPQSHELGAHDRADNAYHLDTSEDAHRLHCHARDRITLCHTFLCLK